MAKLLLAEDNQMNREMLSRRLRRAGHEVIFAFNGQQAVDLAQKANPALILMDLNMPVVDGLEATRQIRRDPRTRKIPVIALTAQAGYADRNRALEAGCDEHHAKPVDLQRLLTQIQFLLDPEAGSTPFPHSATAPAPRRGEATEQIFRGSLKHDLLTPLNHIIGYCEMLLEQAEDAALESFVPDLERTHASGKTLLSVVQELLQKHESGVATLSEQVIHQKIRTPLNDIFGYVEMLQDFAIEGGKVDFLPDLDKIRAAAGNLLNIVQERLIPECTSTERPSGGETTRFYKNQERASPDEPQSRLNGKLLVVDDNPLNRDMLVRRLQRIGHATEEAADGGEALEKIAANEYDLVLLDITMPVLNGYEVIEKLKADPVRRHLPVIVLSASDASEDAARCIEMGAEDHIPKPFDPILLQARISASLEKKRWRDQETLYLRQIEAEKKRSDDLLHVILPKDVAAELKEKHSVQPRRFENAAVLFCDIVGFTAYCEKEDPATILANLQLIVQTFEEITATHGLEKIKTIGDAFMAAAGLRHETENPARDCVRCGLAMIDAAKVVTPFWQIRVGVHAGPVIAGVVGRRKYQYDIWGDTVNTAARLETIAAPGALCVNRDTWSRIESTASSHPQGFVQIKGKLPQEVFRVLDCA